MSWWCHFIWTAHTTKPRKSRTPCSRLLMQRCSPYALWRTKKFKGSQWTSWICIASHVGLNWHQYVYAQQYWCKAVSEVSHILTEFGCDLHDARGNVYGMGDKYREQDLRKILHFHIGIEDRFPVGGWHRWDVERGMEVGRVGARIISNQKPGFCIVSCFESYERGKFQMSKARRLWAYLRKSLLVVVLEICLWRLRIKWILKSLRESGKFHSKIRQTPVTPFELEFLRAVFHATELQFWN